MKVFGRLCTEHKLEIRSLMTKSVRDWLTDWIKEDNQSKADYFRFCMSIYSFPITPRVSRKVTWSSNKNIQSYHTLSMLAHDTTTRSDKHGLSLLYPVKVTIVYSTTYTVAYTGQGTRTTRPCLTGLPVCIPYVYRVQQNSEPIRRKSGNRIAEAYTVPFRAWNTVLCSNQERIQGCRQQGGWSLLINWQPTFESKIFMFFFFLANLTAIICCSSRES